MSENKTLKQYEKVADELLCAIMQKILTYPITIGCHNTATIHFNVARETAQYYLLDAYNEGYDAAIVSQCPRKYKID